MLPTTPTRRRRRRRLIVAHLAAALVASAVALVAGAAPAAADAPTVTGRPCAPGVGVTVVVDLQELGDQGIEVGCAPGQQATGFAALTGAGFTFNEDPGAPGGSVCQVRHQPAAGYPTCWYDGYWASWWSDGELPWAFSSVGPAAGPLPVDRVVGWSWTGLGPDDPDAPIRLAVADLDELLLPEADCSATVQLPTFGIVSASEVLPITLADGRPVEVAVLADGADPSTATWAEATSVPLSSFAGRTRILARRAGSECPGAPAFDATYDVRAAYAPRWSAVEGTPGGPSPAIDKADPRFVGWITGHSDYTPGGNVNPSFQTPDNAHGPVDGSLVVLGDRGSYTATFAVPITDGPGDDLATFENGFASGAADYLELAYVEVSSNGSDFVRFDSASRRAAPVASFGTQDPAELGGLAGKDLTGKGTPFDLSLLAGRPEVRAGTVDLHRITHVRLRDVQGDGADLDSFGRPIYDPNPITGSAGYDLTGIGVLHALDVVAPVVTIDDAPTGTVASRSATVAFTVDDATATVEQQLDGGAWVAATSPITLVDLANGSHTLVVRATDATGNEGRASASWTVDVAPPTTSDEAWVQAAYEDLLDRAPTTSERSATVARLAAGTTRATVARELSTSDEWLGAIVTGLYEDTLGRAPDAGGLAYWTQRLRTGRATVAQAAASFFSSSEHYREIGGGTPATWVDDLYLKLLGRPADAGGRAHWVGRVAARGRTWVAGQLYGSAESRRARVDALYLALLGRAPDAAGRDFWAERITARGDLALAVSLVTSGEYGTRAQLRFP